VPLVVDVSDRADSTGKPEELVNAKGDAQRAVLSRLRDSKEDDNTLVLALAIPKLDGGIRVGTRNYSYS
jgi:hypothetical protein